MKKKTKTSALEREILTAFSETKNFIVNKYYNAFMNKLGIIEGWKNEQENKIKNEQPIALTVQDVKGLEFEIVIVDDKDMTYNEKYVACTRALEKLYFV